MADLPEAQAPAQAEALISLTAEQQARLDAFAREASASLMRRQVLAERA